MEKGRFQCVVGVANIHKSFTDPEELEILKMSTFLPEIVAGNPWLFGGLAAGAVGLACVYFIRKWAAGGVGMCRSLRLGWTGRLSS